VSADGTVIVDNSSIVYIPVDAFALLDLAGFNHSLGSLLWGGIVTNSAVASPATLTVGSDNTSTIFSGSIQDGTSETSFAKTGAGTLTLSGHNTYTGGTAIVAGTLELRYAYSAGTGPITFAGTAATLRIDSDPSANVIRGFTPGDSIDLANVAFDSSGTAII